MIIFMFMIVFSPFTAIIPALYAVNLIYNKKLKIEKNYLNVGLFLLFVWSLISGVVNKSVLSTIASIGIFLYLCVSILFQNYFIKESRITIVLKYLVYLTNLAAFAGVMEKITFCFITIPNHRIASTFGNPNMAGSWFASIILVIIYLKSIEKKREKIKIYNYSLILILIALLLTESSGALIALVGSLGIYYLLRKDRSFKKMLSLVLFVSVIAVVFMIIQSKLTSVTPIGELKVSFSSRYDIWLGSLQMFSQKPILGWGVLGTLEHGVNFMYRNGNSIHSHNIWLSFLVSGGITALLIYLYIKWNLFKDMVKIYKRGNVLLPLLASLNAMVIIQGIVDNSLYAPQLGILFFATVAITVNVANNKIVKKSLIKKSQKEDSGNNEIAV